MIRPVPAATRPHGRWLPEQRKRPSTWMRVGGEQVNGRPRSFLRFTLTSPLLAGSLSVAGLTGSRSQVLMGNHRAMREAVEATRNDACGRWPVGHTVATGRGSTAYRGDVRRKEGAKRLEWGSGWEEGADSPCRLWENRTASRIDQFESHRRNRSHFESTGRDRRGHGLARSHLRYQVCW